MNVHEYCEYRPFVGVLALFAAVMPILFIRHRAGVLWKRILSDFGVAICVLTAGTNIWFIWYATRVCRHMLDLIKS
jgi:hypothetical protein